MDLRIPDVLQELAPDCGASDLARKTGVGRATLNNWLQGRALPTAQLWAEFLSALAIEGDARELAWMVWMQSWRRSVEGAL